MSRASAFGVDGRGKSLAPPIARSASRIGFVLLLTVAGLATGGCSEQGARRAAPGDAERGAELVVGYGCPSCHTIPGIRGAEQLVGPPLLHWSGRVYIAGRLPNTPENLVQWIMDPQSIREPTAMPNMGVTEEDARDIASYLFTLR